MQASTTVSCFVAALSALLTAQSAIALELCEAQTLTSGRPPLSDSYGWATAMDDPYLVVGAPGDDPFGSAAGTVYVYLREDLTWTPQVKLTASDAELEDGFGFSVDIERDRLVVGAPGVSTFFGQFGKAYVFQREGTSWIEQVRRVSSGSSADDNFGGSVSISGERIVVGAQGEDSFTGRAYVFRWNGTAWIEEAALRASDTVVGDGFGSAVAMDGDLLAVGARLDDDACPEDPFCDSGSAYLFRYEKGSWIEKSKITAGDAELFDKFGAYLALDGNRIAVGVPSNDDAGFTTGSAYVFICTGDSCVEEAKLTASDAAALALFGRSIAIDNDLLLAGSPFDDTQAGLASGSAYLFQRSGSSWIEIQKLIPHDAGLGSRAGWGVAMDAGYAVLGAAAVGHAHVYGFNVPPCIPTLSEWGVFSLGIVFLAAGSIVLHQRAFCAQRKTEGRVARAHTGAGQPSVSLTHVKESLL